MTIRFKRTLPDHAHMYHGEELVGELTRQADCLNPGAFYFVIHLYDDLRGPFRVHDRNRLREVAKHRVRTCELM